MGAGVAVGAWRHQQQAGDSACRVSEIGKPPGPPQRYVGVDGHRAPRIASYVATDVLGSRDSDARRDVTRAASGCRDVGAAPRQRPQRHSRVRRRQPAQNAGPEGVVGAGVIDRQARRQPRGPGVAAAADGPGQRRLSRAAKAGAAGSRNDAQSAQLSDVEQLDEALAPVAEFREADDRGVVDKGKQATECTRLAQRGRRTVLGTLKNGSK